MIEAMLRDVGFRTVQIHRGPFNLDTPSPRIVYHAWK
jgi:hypothetical protein